MQTNHASILSELLMCSTALGAGVRPPIDRLFTGGGMIFTSAVSDDFKETMRRASVDFNEATSANEQATRQRIQQLESDVANDVHGALDQLTEARTQLEASRYPFCHDHSAAKDMVLELAAKSRHNHIAILDYHGFRLSMSLKFSPAFSRETALMPMTQSYCVDQATIRVHGSGGKVEHKLPCRSTPAFSYVSSPPVELVKKLEDKLATNTMMSAVKGHVVIISEPAPREAALQVTYKDILKLLNTYYVLGHKPDDEKAHYVWQSPELEEKWNRFATGHDVLKLLEIPQDRMQRADNLLNDWHIKPKVAAANASRAALCMAALETIKIDHNGNPTKIALREHHYEMAVAFFKELYRTMLVRVHAAAKLAENAAIARATKAGAIPSPSRQEAAMDALEEAIRSAPNRMISRDAAIRLPDVSAALLDYLVANRSTLVELKGRDIVNMGRTKRAYALREDTSTDVGEAMDDLNEADSVYAKNKHDPMFDNMETARHEIMALAKTCDRGPLGLPCVPITSMTSEQLRCLPAILAEYSDSFVIRGMPDIPELPHLVKSVTDPDAPLEPGVPVVWVRRGPDGKDLRDWKLAARLGFSDTWGSQ